MTYDSVDVLQSFSERKGISYPMLSDPESKIIRAFGILNDSVPKGTPFYGIPYPGTYVVDAQGTVRSKFFETDYKERYSAGSILLRNSPSATPEGWNEVETQHLRLRYRASDGAISGGTRITLLLEIEMKPKMHVYAPGVQSSYIPVKWDIEPGPWKLHDVQWPQSRMLHLPAISETVPVYENKLAVARDLTFSQQKELVAGEGNSKQLTLDGTFRYQACDDKKCYLPVNVPLKWTFRVQPHDSQRAPDALRRK